MFKKKNTTVDVELESRISALESRNARVDAGKAWEGSLLRRATIAALTYIVVIAYSSAIGGVDVFLTSLVPVVGYLLSTLTFGFVKHRWVERRLSSQKLPS